jgi:hypothetical protein
VESDEPISDSTVAKVMGEQGPRFHRMPIASARARSVSLMAVLRDVG